MGFLSRKKSQDRYVGEAAFCNAVDTLYANVRFSDVDREVGLIAVTSAVPDEGKSTVSLALAGAMARSGKRTLLVECDMRRHTLAARLGARAGGGVFAVLSGQMRLSEAAWATEAPNLWFLDAEPGVPDPAGVLGSERFARMLASLKRQFDYVVMDTPPLLAFSDAAIVASRADAALIVVREGHAHRRELEQARAQLDQSGARVLGAVTNMCREDPLESYYRYAKGAGIEVPR